MQILKGKKEFLEDGFMMKATLEQVVRNLV